ncbi:hypothetical protein Hdeb2414_s0026g00674581 [Helianthus debilis subsp. tardiflorus]
MDQSEPQFFFFFFEKHAKLNLQHIYAITCCFFIRIKYSFDYLQSYKTKLF